ncbi:AI-2E family transporter [Microbacterium esteraromaticum]|uniref:AI-2E family transporter n=1 Tax=Microbacterium esteraromaticum TaxID=57043 RepID=A0A7D8AKR1_9MICO|nr:AI-2E family transporter [Microbacterium esteraromaticum]QMU96847.1 AI-2E family transporter [Microbacterium esteraromaticum]
MSTEEPSSSASRDSGDSRAESRATRAADDAEAAEIRAADEADDTAEAAERAEHPSPADAPTPRRSTWTRMDRPFRLGFLITLGGLSAFLLALALTNLSTVLVYVAFALFAALGLNPAVRLLERRGLSRGLSVAIVIVALVVAVGLILVMIVPVVVEQVSSFVKSVPQVIDDFMHTDLYLLLEKQFGDQIDSLLADGEKLLTDGKTLTALGGGALKVGSSIATGISAFVIVFVLTLYFVVGLPGIITSMLRLAPARKRSQARGIVEQITESVGGYVQGMVILAFANSMMALVLYLLLGLPFPPLMAVVAFLVTLIPLVGPLLFLAIGTVVAVLANPVNALIFGVVYLVYIQIEAYVLTPKVMNRTVSVPGLLVVIGALVGGTLLGLLGALVAVPATASILIVLNQIFIPRQDARV